MKDYAKTDFLYILKQVTYGIKRRMQKLGQHILQCFDVLNVMIYLLLAKEHCENSLKRPVQ